LSDLERISNGEVFISSPFILTNWNKYEEENNWERSLNQDEKKVGGVLPWFKVCFLRLIFSSYILIFLYYSFTSIKFPNIEHVLWKLLSQLIFQNQKRKLLQIFSAFLPFPGSPHKLLRHIQATSSQKKSNVTVHLNKYPQLTAMPNMRPKF
jgi:hypothetical protein